MNTKAETALKKSIAHWKRMRDDPTCGESPGMGDCALCREFYLKPSIKSGGTCVRCPVMVKTQRKLCEGSPFGAACMAWIYRNSNRPAWQRAATKEIKFLESLLPKKTVRTP